MVVPAHGDPLPHPPLVLWVAKAAVLCLMRIQRPSAQLEEAHCHQPLVGELGRVSTGWEAKRRRADQMWEVTRPCLKKVEDRCRRPLGARNRCRRPLGAKKRHQPRPSHQQLAHLPPLAGLSPCKGCGHWLGRNALRPQLPEYLGPFPGVPEIERNVGSKLLFLFNFTWTPVTSGIPPACWSLYQL